VNWSAEFYYFAPEVPEPPEPEPEVEEFTLWWSGNCMSSGFILLLVFVVILVIIRASRS